MPPTPPRPKPALLAAAPFGNESGEGPHNASEVVALADSRFLFCDNNIGDTLFEMRVDRAGRLTGHLIRHTIRGVSPAFYDDFESMAVAQANGRNYLILATSFSLKIKAKDAVRRSRRGRRAVERESLLRVTMGAGREHQAEIIPGFRSWLLDNTPDLGRKWRKSWRRIPDDGGLNVEGLAWHPSSQEMQFGLRTPVIDGRPVILRVRVKDVGGIWNLSNFEIMPPVLLAMEPSKCERGIRTMEYDPVSRQVLIVTGNARSGERVPFQLCAWNGNAKGVVTCFDGLQFDPKFRVEGVTPGTIGGRPAIIFVDDRGGYQVLFGDDRRLARAPVKTPAPTRRQSRRS